MEPLVIQLTLMTAGRNTWPCLQSGENTRPSVVPNGQNESCCQLRFRCQLVQLLVIDFQQCISIICACACGFKEDNGTFKPDSELSLAESFGCKTAGLDQGRSVVTCVSTYVIYNVEVSTLVDSMHVQCQINTDHVYFLGVIATCPPPSCHPSAVALTPFSRLSASFQAFS